MMILSLLLACNSSENSTPALKDTSDQKSASENNQENNNQENNNQEIPNIDFEWNTEEKITKNIEDTGSSLVMPNFSRTDLNPFSSTYGSEISPQGYLGSVTGWYFIKATWGYCRGQFGLLNTLQTELDTDYPDLSIEILAINRTDVALNEALAEQYQLPLDELWTSFFGPESPSQSSLPFVNDLEWAIWGSWGEYCTIEGENPDTASETTLAHISPSDHWRDLYILSADNELLAVYNLTTYNLSQPENYNEIKSLLIEAARDAQGLNQASSE